MFQTLTRGVLVALPAHCPHAIKNPKGLKWEYQTQAADPAVPLCSHRAPVPRGRCCGAFGAAIMKPPYFRNVDLDIESKSPLRSLARALGNKVSVMFSGRMNGNYCLFVETAGAERYQDWIINALCAVVEQLPANARRVWNAAHRKEFDLGYETRLVSQRANRFAVRPSTLRRMASLGASLAVTIYAQQGAEQDHYTRRRDGDPVPNRTRSARRE